VNYCAVLTTTESQEEAEKIACALLEKRAAACVQIAPVLSLYRWKGKTERSNEMRLLIKTSDDRYPAVESLIRQNHSYEVPQIVKLPISAGLPEYLDWISEETKQGGL